MNSKKRVPARFPHDIDKRLKNGNLPSSVYTRKYRQNPYKQVWYQGRSHGEHRVVWIKANGPIPDGHIIHHKDGNKRNVAIDNLELMMLRPHSVMSGRERPVRYKKKYKIKSR